MADYAKPDVLVSTDWVAQNTNNPNVRIVEVDVDTKGYDEGHVPGAVGWNWQTQLCDQLRRDVIGKQQLEQLMGSSGIDNGTTVVLYGDNNNWFAAWAYWQLKMYGHKDVRLMNGGRKKWIAEGRELSQDAPSRAAKQYSAKEPDPSLRAFLPQVQDAAKQVQAGKAAMVDVRSPDEFSGKILSPPGLPETCQRGGHIPGAANIPWGQACNEDGTFKSADELKKLYEGKGISANKDVIAYCRIGERSSHTWFVLKELLGFPNVRNYDGSWTEWGNLVGAPVER
ncbi:MAG TPA: sulfurtransferase [Acidobacteriota bacterium]